MPAHPTAARELRRRDALRLHAEGLSAPQIAARMEVCLATVYKLLPAKKAPGLAPPERLDALAERAALGLPLFVEER